MKKITQAVTPGGAPIYLDDFKGVFNDEIWDAMETFLYPYTSDTEGVIVSGNVIGGSGPSSYTISGGIVFLNGEFMRLPVFGGLSLPFYIIPATPVNTTRTFEDTVIRTLFITKDADVDTVPPGAGQYITVSSSTYQDSRRLKKLMTSNTMLLTKIIDIGVWDMDATPSISVPHGLADFNKIRYPIGVTIRSDDDALIPSIAQLDGNGAIAGSIGGIAGTDITLSRVALGGFDSTDFDKTSGSFNRGWIKITYEP